MNDPIEEQYEFDACIEDDDVYREIDLVEADKLYIVFSRADGKQITYNCTIPYDLTYMQMADMFAEFMSDVYEYEILVKAESTLKKKWREGTKPELACADCTNPACLSGKGC